MWYLLFRFKTLLKLRNVRSCDKVIKMDPSQRHLELHPAHGLQVEHLHQDLHLVDHHQLVDQRPHYQETFSPFLTNFTRGRDISLNHEIQLGDLVFKDRI